MHAASAHGSYINSLAIVFKNKKKKIFIVMESLKSSFITKIS